MISNLSEIAARWLGMDLEWHLAHNMKWNPLEDRNDLVRVEEKLHCEIRIIEDSFTISRLSNRGYRVWKSGFYPADYPTAILELVKTLYERGRNEIQS